MEDKMAKDVKDVKPIHKNLPPVGYVPIELSTKGKMGVPALVHVRNFKTEELLDLSLYNEEMIPPKLISILNSLIYEDVNVGEWPDRVITELLIRIYVNFFTPIIPEVTFPWEQEDIDYLLSNNREEDANRLKAGAWKPITSVNLTKVNITNLSDEVKPYITIKKKREDGTFFSAKFVSYPRYGDSLTIKKFIENKFEESDKKYEELKKRLDLKNLIIREGRDLSLVPSISSKEYLEWQVYEAEKAIYIAMLLQAINLVAYGDQDLTEASLEDKVRYVSQPEFDTNVGKKIEKHYNDLLFGLDPIVEILNPITSKPCKRRFSFRIVDVIQTLREADADGYSIEYDD